MKKLRIVQLMNKSSYQSGLSISYHSAETPEEFVQQDQNLEKLLNKIDMASTAIELPIAQKLRPIGIAIAGHPDIQSTLNPRLREERILKKQRDREADAKHHAKMQAYWSKALGGKQ